MYEIVIVEGYLYRKESGVLKHILDFKNDIWWFSEPSIDTLEEAVHLTGHEHDWRAEPPVQEAQMKCDSIRFQFKFCPNPFARNYDVSALHDDSVYGKRLDELFADDVSKFAAIVTSKLADDEFEVGNPVYIYCLYDVELFESYAFDGGIDYVEAQCEYVGEIDLDKLPLSLVG